MATSLEGAGGAIILLATFLLVYHGGARVYLSSGCSGVRMKHLLGLLVAAFVSLTDAARASDKISPLPGVTFKVNFDQYAGYLSGGDGLSLFYW